MKVSGNHKLSTQSDRVKKGKIERMNKRDGVAKNAVAKNHK